jgi:uncharacterized protein (DUF849 family)
MIAYDSTLKTGGEHNFCAFAGRRDGKNFRLSHDELCAKYAANMRMVSRIPEGSTWTVSGVGRATWPMVTAAILMGGHVRVGFEDNLYLARGQKAASNGELVAKVVSIAKQYGREIATCDDARRILGLAR